MTNIIRTSDLDFQNIKTSLKNHFKSGGEFADYNFEGSGLSNILDVLSWNTHLNGVISNFALNESFLTTAQLRSSIINHAESLGYIVQSTISASAEIQVFANDSTVQSLEKNTVFKATSSSGTFDFLLDEKANLVENDGVFQFISASGNTNLRVVEGIREEKSVITGFANQFVFSTENVDCSQMRVNVYEDHTENGTPDVYVPITEETRITPESKVFFIKETPNQSYEIIFGVNNILGRNPTPGNLVKVEFVVSSGELANNITSFQKNNCRVVTVLPSRGGKSRETKESIRTKAANTFLTQRRAVTAQDTEDLIKDRFLNIIKDVKAFSGHQAIPRDYGNTYVSLVFEQGFTDEEKENTKKEIREYIQSKNILSIGIKFVDTIRTFVDVSCAFNYATNIINARDLDSLVRDRITQFFSEFTSEFDVIFRKSNLLADIDSSSESILNSRLDIRLRQTFETNQDTRIYSPTNVQSLVFPTKISSVIIPVIVIGNQQQVLIESVNSQLIYSEINIGKHDDMSITLNPFSVNTFFLSGQTPSIIVIPEDDTTIYFERNYVVSLGNITVSSSIDR